MTPFFCATAYGLTLESSLPLPELKPAPKLSKTVAGFVVGVRISTGDVTAEDCEPPGIVRVERAEAVVAWPQVGRFRLRAGREILIEPAPGVAQSTLRAFLLGPVLAIALHQLGFLMLHCSAVEVPDAWGQPGAVAFLGDSGEGKSSLASAFHAQGYRLVADDYLAIPPPPEGAGGVESQEAAWPVVFPGYPALRLWPRTLRALGEDAQSLPLLYPASFEIGGAAPPAEGADALKRVRPVPDSFATDGLPLRGLYVLQSRRQPDAAVELRTLSPGQALPRLTHNIYFTQGPGSEATTEQFLSCGALANHLPVRLLRRPRDISRLAEAVQIVLQDQRHQDQRHPAEVPA